jgi:hypothetical protein
MHMASRPQIEERSEALWNGLCVRSENNEERRCDSLGRRLNADRPWALSIPPLKKWKAAGNECIDVSDVQLAATYLEEYLRQGAAYKYDFNRSRHSARVSTPVSRISHPISWDSARRYRLQFIMSGLARCG